MSKGTTEKRRLRRQAQRQQKRESQSGSETHVEQTKVTGNVCPHCGSTHVSKLYQFSVQQDYTITCDEDGIDEIERSSSPGDEERVAQYVAKKKAQFHRMYKAIMADSKALYAILEYKVFSEQDSLGDGSGGYVQGNYEKEMSFFDILVQYVHLFAEVDRKWLLDMKQDHAESETKIQEKTQQLIGQGLSAYEARSEAFDAVDHFDLSVQVEELEDCFKVEPSGWCLHTHAHA